MFAPFLAARAWRLASSSAGKPSFFFVGSSGGSWGDPSRGIMKPAGATEAFSGGTKPAAAIFASAAFGSAAAGPRSMSMANASERDETTGTRELSRAESSAVDDFLQGACRPVAIWGPLLACARVSVR